MNKVISTWVYCPPKGKKYVHSQTGSNSDTAAIQALYWRCAACLFASSYSVHGEDVRHILFSNVTPPKYIYGIDLHEWLAKYNVEIHLLENVTCTPQDYFEAWNTQFIVVDVLRELITKVAPTDIVLILDSDCIFVRPLSQEIFEKLNREKALLYTIDMGRDYVENGLSPDQMGEVEVSIEGKQLVPDEAFLYQGGEIVCLRGDQISEVEAECRRVLDVCLQRHSDGLLKYNEEAHLLSHVYRKMNYRSYGANDSNLIKRLWTDRSNHRNIEQTDDDLIIWHLPSEKKVGFERYFKKPTADRKVLARWFRVEESSWDRLRGNLRLSLKKAVLKG